MQQIKVFLGKNKFLILILLLAFSFRFYRLLDLQYWSVDEEVATAVIQKVAVEHKLLLVSPNVAIATSLGPFFHLLSAPIFWGANFNVILILAFGSILGVVTTGLIYLTGRELGGRRVGLIAAFLYACSFLMAFSDRRWWPLSLDPLLSVLAVFAVVKMVQGKLRHFLLLAIASSFSWHADPSLTVIIVFGVLAFLIFRLPIVRKDYILGGIYLVISVLPFLVFEARHPSSISHPIKQLMSRPAQTRVARIVFTPVEYVRDLSRSLFLSRSDNIEEHLCYCLTYPSPPLSPLPEIAVLAVLLAPIFMKLGKNIKILYVYLGAFIFGLLTFTLILKSTFHQHYFVIVWPVFFLICAFVIDKMLTSKYALVGKVFLAVVLLCNIYVLFSSHMRYPLIDKEKIVEYAMREISGTEYSLRTVGDNKMQGGFGGLFFLKQHYPANKDYYEAWDWVYQAYSLYPIETKIKPSGPTVMIYPRDSQFGYFPNFTSGNISVSIIDQAESSE